MTDLPPNPEPPEPPITTPPMPPQPIISSMGDPYWSWGPTTRQMVGGDYNVGT